MSKFKVGDVVTLVVDVDKRHFIIDDVSDIGSEVFYFLEGRSKAKMGAELNLVEPPLTKLQAMHNMLDGQVYKTVSGLKVHAIVTSYLVKYDYIDEGYEFTGCWDHVATWTPYTPPKEWYEEIPEGGVLCWVDDSCLTKEYPQIVVDYKPNNVYKFKTAHSGWAYATPVLPEECLQPKED